MSYLGLGVQEPVAAWGLMLQGSAEDYATTAPWIAIFPGPRHRADRARDQPVRRRAARRHRPQAARQVVWAPAHKQGGQSMAASSYHPQGRGAVDPSHLPAAGSWAATPGGRQPAIIPGADWERAASPEAAGFRSSGFEALEAQLRHPADHGVHGRVGRPRRLHLRGDVAQACYLASARKSILSMLFGKYVANGTINLDRTMADLGTRRGRRRCLPIEKTARIRDLLIASSGVHHARAGSPGDDPNCAAARLQAARYVLPLQQLGLQPLGRRVREDSAARRSSRRLDEDTRPSRCRCRTSSARVSA